MGGNGLAHFVGRPDRHSALVDDDFVGGHDVPQFLGHPEHVTQVCGSVFTRRGGQRQEDDVRAVHRPFQFRGELQASRSDVPVEQRVEVGLVNGDFAALHRGHLGFIDVDANDVVAGFCEARPCDEANVSGSDDCNVHVEDVGLSGRQKSEKFRNHTCLHGFSELRVHGKGQNASRHVVRHRGALSHGSGRFGKGGL